MSNQHTAPPAAPTPVESAPAVPSLLSSSSDLPPSAEATAAPVEAVTVPTSTSADPSTSAPSTADAPVEPLTKTALKRQRKQEAYAAQKLQRRAHEKEKRKARNQETKRLVKEGVIEKPVDTKKLKRQLAGKSKPHGARIVVDMGFDELMNDKVRSPLRTTLHTLYRFDFDFSCFRLAQEIKSMASQLAYCYSANRATPQPFPLLITSFNGRLAESYKKREDHKSWKGVEWWEESLEALYEGRDEATDAAAAEAAAAQVPVASTSSTSEAPSADAPPPATTSTDNATSTSTTSAPVNPEDTSTTVTDALSPSAAVDAPSTSALDSTPSASSSSVPIIRIGALSGKPRTSVPKSSLVYLTGDSPNVLTSLEPGKTYILGGIVDRNRYKSLCLNKAIELGIEHAQLPIGEHLPEMGTRKVLTVNQVYEILVNWVQGEEVEVQEGETLSEEEKQGRRWRDALRKAMPERKFDPDQRRKRKEANAEKKKHGVINEDGVYVVAEGSEGEDEDDEEEATAQEEVELTGGAPTTQEGIEAAMLP